MWLYDKLVELITSWCAIYPPSVKGNCYDLRMKIRFEGGSLIEVGCGTALVRIRGIIVRSIFTSIEIRFLSSCFLIRLLLITVAK